jgi:stage V sporulation protein G
MQTTTSLFSQVRVTLVEKDSLRALATVTAHDSLILTGLRVVEGKNGLFVSMPNRKTAAGEYQDIYFPASKAVRDELQALVLEAYKKETTMAAVA